MALVVRYKEVVMRVAIRTGYPRGNNKKRDGEGK